MSTAPQPVANAGELQALLPRGTTLYSVVTHESRSGDTCRLVVLASQGGQVVSYTAAAAAALGLRISDDEMFVLRPRELAGVFVVKEFANKLHGDGRAFKHVILV